MRNEHDDVEAVAVGRLAGVRRGPGGGLPQVPGAVPAGHHRPGGVPAEHPARGGCAEGHRRVGARHHASGRLPRGPRRGALRDRELRGGDVRRLRDERHPPLAARGAVLPFGRHVGLRRQLRDPVLGCARGRVPHPRRGRHHEPGAGGGGAAARLHGLARRRPARRRRLGPSHVRSRDPDAPVAAGGGRDHGRAAGGRDRDAARLQPQRLVERLGLRREPPAERHHLRRHLHRALPRSGAGGRRVTTFARALCRRPGPDFAAGQTTFDLAASGEAAPDFALATAQHAAYVAALAEAGLAVTVLDALPGFPDAHFVEDTAIVTPRVAVITRPGHPARRGEEESVAGALTGLGERPVARIAAPGTVDGGDVLQHGDHVFIGVSARTNAAGAAQLAAILERHGHTVAQVPVAAGLHFKSSVNEVGEALLVTADFTGRPELDGFRVLTVPPGEEYAGNTLRLNGTLLTPSGYPRTRELLAATGLEIRELDTSEFRKLDGGLTCLSLRW
ncbi:hypothetical protein KDM41_18075 [bacterium]|nr:hypothetical protein [bacterium]